jgi:hypothetical protein
MIIKLLTLLFNTLIGKLPEDTKKELEGKFTSLITEVVKAGAKGAVEGMKK